MVNISGIRVAPSYLKAYIASWAKYICPDSRAAHLPSRVRTQTQPTLVEGERSGAVALGGSPLTARRNGDLKHREQYLPSHSCPKNLVIPEVHGISREAWGVS